MIAGRTLAGLLAAGVLVSCSGEETRPPQAIRSAPPPARATGGGDPQDSPRLRKRSLPKLPLLVNEGLDRIDRRRVARATRDLRRLGFWDDLTDHLAVVRVSTRPGPDRIPLDGHLADALYTAKIRGRIRGRVCDVLIFSDALVGDVERQEAYYVEGRLASPAPTLRQFWAVILAHELAHCSTRGQRGERHSTRWERRVLAAFGAERLGS